ncbi:ABC transporter ATP-binding protein [Sedimentibacter hydroxybenzoicus DSM 7310]|uniref:ABC transporter ATP-binding protein n=1 Tax=Sedimentibacter hydroxybenzoicus DSM 7310 TaxID=1123245 RepID=A0A974GX89_SEDHY|nr:ABC transporter ATP-binding protein [Sedimentibacter hydroxybenzoicus]NYB74976.1 ABC transporter ATP-binding protein [Sedimentibacter hydroxybenzoicus DSM 7310]
MTALMKRIFMASGKYKGRIALAFVFSFLKGLLKNMPIALGFFVLAAFYNGTATTELCIRIGIALIVIILLQILFQNIADRLQSAAGYLLFADKRMELGAHLRKMPMGYFTEGNIGKISSVLSTDMVFIEENCMTVLADMMNYIFSQIIMLAFLFFFNPWIGIAGVVVTFMILLLGRGLKKEAMEDSAIRQEQLGILTDAVLDFTEGIGIIKSYNMLGEKSKTLTDSFKEVCRTSIEFEENHTPWQRGLNLIYSLGVTAVIALSAFLYFKGTMDTPYMIGIMLFVFDLFGPLKALYGQSARLTVMNSCMDRIEEVFAQKELPDNGVRTIPESTSGPQVQFENVSFAYGEKNVLNNISFSLEKNKMLALVGPSGGGKSTIASLLARFWDIKSGKILVRGQDVRDVPLSNLMDHISMVFQRVYLFQDTIYNNIIMGRPTAGRDEVIEAAKKARCYDFIMALPDGFETIVGEGGASLSGGEQQRISIARCILKDALIVILDEATASVDADNESYIQQAISELCKGKTLLVIAHRLNTIRHADKILVISDGKIAEQGTHEELMHTGGIYKHFVTARENSRGWSRNRGCFCQNSSA